MNLFNQKKCANQGRPCKTSEIMVPWVFQRPVGWKNHIGQLHCSQRLLLPGQVLGSGSACSKHRSLGCGFSQLFPSVLSHTSYIDRILCCTHSL